MEDETTPLLKTASIQTTTSTIVRNEKASTELRRAHFWLVPVLLMMYVGINTGYYVIQQWVQRFIVIRYGVDTGNLTTTAGCDAQTNISGYAAYMRVEQDTAQWEMYVSLATTIPAFFASTLIPSYSDSFGRKYLFILGITSTTLRLAVTSVCIYFQWDLIWIVVAAVVDGMTGGFYTIMSASMSYIADITPTGSKRTTALTVNDGLLLICSTFSGVGSGFFIQHKGFLLPIVSCCGLCVVAFFTAVCFLPETHMKHHRTKPKSALCMLKRMTHIYTNNAFKKRRSAYLILITAYFFQELVSTHRSSIEILYQLGRPFCWSAEKIGLFSAARHFTQGIAGMVLIVPLKSCMSDITLTIVSAIFCTGSFVMEALAITDTVLYLVPVLATFAFLAVPLLKSLLSIMTPADTQGSLFASIVLVQSVCGVMADFLFNQILQNNAHTRTRR
ncbi:proton-coupled folate transporter-like isoform X2 [Dreissena polymorpha]|uniref:proton-coupled folate transporter-like isoform X2 n=1 Tax=Dreissena polymorpha TaxID=45954 RepID=UPI0022644A44|nr:proton-coupled folate transporter-like isoform X2 [Dreissena polymorpha]